MSGVSSYKFSHVSHIECDRLSAEHQGLTPTSTTAGREAQVWVRLGIARTALRVDIPLVKMVSETIHIIVIGVAIILPGLWVSHMYRRKFHRLKPSLPPGPKRWPIIGNLLDLPKSYNWIHWSKYKDLYGPIASISVMGQHIILLNDHRTSVDLLDKRSNIYSDRLMSPFLRL